MRRTLLSLLALSLLLASAAPAVAATRPYCGLRWGSLPKTSAPMSSGSITAVRAGRHACFDRVVVDVAGRAPGYSVRYVTAVRAEGSGAVVPVRGGARLEVTARAPAYDARTGRQTLPLPNPREVLGVGGFRTLRQVAWAGSFEGQTTFGVGVRARLPFRVFTLPGPGTRSRLVIDVAHRW